MITLTSAISRHRKARSIVTHSAYGQLAPGTCSHCREPWPCTVEQLRMGHSECEAILNSEISHSTFWKDIYNEAMDKLGEVRKERDLMMEDLHSIGEALGIGAKSYSGHEAVGRDFLPRIRTLIAALRKSEIANARLDYAIARYGEHRRDCEWGRASIPGTSRCTCGFHSAAIADPTNELLCTCGVVVGPHLPQCPKEGLA